MAAGIMTGPTIEKNASGQEDPLPLSGSGHKFITSEYDSISGFINREDFYEVAGEYPFVSTLYYLSLAKSTCQDPIMQQLCPSKKELEDNNASEDPLSEEENSPVPGLVHRYPDRALMIVTNICFMNCRHCTRKRLWKNGRRACSAFEIDRMVEYIKSDTKIRDVIVSGGDPLTFSDEILDEILFKIRQIKHVEIIRIGTRAPVVNPQRITDSLVGVLKKYRPVWLNTQFNHINEITSFSEEAVRKIMEAGVPVNNQSVLLKGINDTAEDMIALCHGLLKIGVRPYYLFHCDPVLGTSHFRTSISKGLEIIEKMRGHTSGLAVPTFVVDAVGGGGKIPLQPEYIAYKDSSKIILRNYKNQNFIYEDLAEGVLYK